MEMAVRGRDGNMLVKPSLQAHQPPGYVNRAREAHPRPLMSMLLPEAALSPEESSCDGDQMAQKPKICTTWLCKTVR